MQSLTAGPVLFDVTGVANAVLYVRVDPVPGQAGSFEGVRIKAATSIAPSKPGASVLIAAGPTGAAADEEAVE